MKTYVTTLVKFCELEKKLNRLFKKLDAIGAKYTFKKIKTFVREVPVYAVDELTQSMHKIDLANVECVEFELDFDKYVVGNYRVGAVVEATNTENNIVYPVDEEVDFNEYRTAALRCDHCGTNHRRVKCVVLIDNETGAEKMVGRACLKDFIGYEVETFYSCFNDIQQIVLDGNDDLRIMANELGHYKRVIDTEKYLAACIQIIDDAGYAKTTKFDAEKVKATETDIEKAKKVIEYFKNIDDDKLDNFGYNVKMFVTGATPIYYANGFVAYAYVLYKKLIEKDELAAKKAIENAETKFYGNIGDKINITGTLTRAGYYDTQYGTVIIFKIKDGNGNVFIWKTTTYVDIESDRKVTVRGTIKEHNEYRGEKQTVLTRCKIAEVVCA